MTATCAGHHGWIGILPPHTDSCRAPPAASIRGMQHTKFLPHLTAAATLGLALLLPAAHAQQVYRCGNTYSDAPCGDQPALDLTPPVQTLPTPGEAQVFLCRRSQSHFWSQQPCNGQGASTLHRQPVPSQWTWEQQRQHAEREWQRAQRRHAAAASAPSHHVDSQSLQAQRSRQRPDCDSFKQRIRHLDAMGRAGGTASFMERLRGERKAVRDAQYKAGC